MYFNSHASTFIVFFFFWLPVMGAPKQKMDGGRSVVLYLPSNVDLKDKWRNLCMMANGLGSREKSILALKRLQWAPEQDDSPSGVRDVPQSDEEIADAKPLPASSGPVQIGAPNRKGKLKSSEVLTHKGWTFLY
ncbi:hypothetical protein Nepgr_004927 [Nepenthes gracilis]|uniref:Uncharacterized protein n=1 Tax=Nepenthes gracilis TaxID=150966 RepID=A0AAD3XFR3_NEPGR|nr:hypothetical protein Nepgr_004927 [Nepenthes gracilis]